MMLPKRQEEDEEDKESKADASKKTE